MKKYTKSLILRRYKIFSIIIIIIIIIIKGKYERGLPCLH